MTDPSYIFGVGYLSFSGMGTTLSVNKAFVFIEHHYDIILPHNII